MTVGSTTCSCAAGFSLNSTRCDRCPVNTFKANVANSSCTDCSLNSTTNGALQSISQTQCLCLPGFLGATGHTTCQSCPQNSWKSTIANTVACTACSGYTSTVSTGASSITSCQCSPGFEFLSTSCVSCNLGFFKNDTSNSTCKSCPSYSNTTAIRSTEQSNCTCNPGAFRNASAGSGCSPCTFGFYKAARGDEATCQSCPPRSTTLVQSAVSKNDCLCEPGTYIFDHLSSILTKLAHRIHRRWRKLWLQRVRFRHL